MRLPNGYGSVYKLSGKRRKPYAAAITTGWSITADGKKRQKRTIIGYYEDKEKALSALADYNGNPYDLSQATATFADVYDLWYKNEITDNAKASTVRGYKSAYKRCERLHNMRMSEIRTFHLQKVLDDNRNMSYESLNKVRVLFNKLYAFCIKRDFLQRSYAVNLTIKSEHETTEKHPFSTEEIQMLWKYADTTPYIKLVLMLIYSGVRINEMLDLKISDVDFKNQVFHVTDSKTKAGVRTVPIADKVLPFWYEFIKQSRCEYAITTKLGKRMYYDNFRRKYWEPLMSELKLEHNIHETRHTCISQLTMTGANLTTIKMIVGHKSLMSLTEAVYTHIEPQELVKTINLIP